MILVQDCWINPSILFLCQWRLLEWLSNKSFELSINWFINWFIHWFINSVMNCISGCQVAKVKTRNDQLSELTKKFLKALFFIPISYFLPYMPIFYFPCPDICYCKSWHLLTIYSVLRMCFLWLITGSILYNSRRWSTLLSFLQMDS